MPDLEIHLFGQFRVLVDGVPIEESRWPRKKAKVLLKQLALAPRRELHREQLIESLWPGTDFDSGLNNLHKVVHAARRALEPELKPGSASRFLLTQDSLVQLAPEPAAWIDAEAFERKATLGLAYPETAALEAAAELYSGDLLLEDLYEDWASVRREQLQLLYHRVLDRLASNYEAANDPRALETLAKLAGQSPLNESAQRRLMKMYAALGRRDLALAQYRSCRDTLRKELDAEPEVATRQLYEQILAGGMEPEAAPEPALAAAVDVDPAPVAPVTRRRGMAIGAALALVALLAAGWWVYRSWTPRIGSLAVLPVTVENDDEQLAYVAEGITESLINRLSQLPGLRVMARATVFAYRGKTGDPRSVGRDLHVDAVVSGGLKRVGTNLTVSSELVSVEDGSRLWGHVFSMPANNLAALAESLGSEMEAALKMKLTDEQRAGEQRRTNANAEAYRLYLVGRYYWNKRTAEGFRKAIGYFNQSVERDPSFGLAYAGLADSYGLLGFADGVPSDYFPRARAAAQKALALNDRLAEAHTSLAMVRALFDWDWPGAEAEFHRAIELNSGYATAHHWYGVYLGSMGRFDDGARELGQALNLDPLSAIINVNAGYPMFYQRRFPEAIACYRRALEITPGFAVAHQDLMSAHAGEGDLAKAMGEGVLFLGDSGEAELARAVSEALDERGWQQAARVWLSSAEAADREAYKSPMIPAYLHALLGDKDRTLQWLETAYQERSPALVYVAVDPTYAFLYGDPRFEDLLGRMHLAHAK